MSTRPRVLTVASTTDTQEEINQVAGVDENIEQQRLSEREGEETQRQEPSSTQDGATARQPVKSKHDWRKRVDRLTSRNYDLAEELRKERELRENVERENTRLKAGGEKTPPEEKTVNKRPVQADFKTMDEYFEALSDWTYKTNQEKANATAQNAEDTRKMQEKFDAYNERIEAFKRDGHADWSKVVGAATFHVPKAAQLAIIEMENGPEVAYYLAQHEDDAAEILRMSDLQAIGEVWRLSDYLVAQAEARKEKGKNKGKVSSGAKAEDSPDEEEEEQEEEEPTVEQEDEEEEERPAATSRTNNRVSTTAPTPITPVGRRGAARSTVPTDELSYREYARRRRSGQLR